MLLQNRVITVSILLCLLSSFAFAQSEFPMDGKGVFIKNIRGYNFKPATPELELGLDAYMQMLRQAAQCNDGSATCTFVRSLNLPEPAGFGRSGEKSIRSYTAPQMALFLRSIGVSWVAIRAMDATTASLQFDQRFIDACHDQDIKVFGIHVLRAQLWDDNNPNSVGVKQADSIATLLNGLTNVAGIIITPGFNVLKPEDPVSDFYQAPGAGEVARSYLEQISLPNEVPLAYSPVAAIECTSETIVQVHRTLLYDPKVLAVIPRCYWRASTPATADVILPSHGRQRVFRFMKNAVYPWLFYKSDAVTNKPIIPIGQAEKRSTLFSEVARFAEFTQKYQHDNAPQGKDMPKLQGVGYWAIDEFNFLDLLGFATMAWPWVNPSDPYNFGPGELPPPFVLQAKPCNKPWFPGIVPRGAIPPRPKLAHFWAGVPECLPVE